MASFVCMASSFRIYCNVAFYQKKHYRQEQHSGLPYRHRQGRSPSHFGLHVKSKKRLPMSVPGRWSRPTTDDRGQPYARVADHILRQTAESVAGSCPCRVVGRDLFPTSGHPTGGDVRVATSPQKSFCLLICPPSAWSKHRLQDHVHHTDPQSHSY